MAAVCFLASLRFAWLWPRCVAHPAAYVCRRFALGRGRRLFALTAPVAAILLTWMLWNERVRIAGSRAGRSSWARPPVRPSIRLFFKAPRQVFFNIFEYQALYRRANWPGATLHDLGVITAWLNSTQALLIGGLAFLGVCCVYRNSAWGSEFRLAMWLCLGLALFIALTHPTFERYFVFVVPFAEHSGSGGTICRFVHAACWRGSRSGRAKLRAGAL